jgi:hypothetical protein
MNSASPLSNCFLAVRAARDGRSSVAGVYRSGPAHRRCRWGLGLDALPDTCGSWTRVRASSRCRRGSARAWPLLVLLGLLTGGPARSSAETYTAEAVKAAFLYRFTGYVEWPGPTKAEPFTIAVLDAQPVADALARLLPSQTVGGRPAYVRAISGLDELGSAEVLYVGRGPESRVARVARSLQSRPVLLVTDQPGALDRGSMLNFVIVDRRVRFEVSLAAANRAGLNLRAGLLSVAHRVEKEP